MPNEARGGPDRAWEQKYRDVWRWDRTAWGTHCVDCYPTNCPYRVYVRDGVVVREEQGATFETVEEGKEEQILGRLIQGAVLAVFNRHFNVVELEEVVTRFKTGHSVEVSDALPSVRYAKMARGLPGLEPAVAKICDERAPALVASAVEFILEGLHLNKRLNKDRVAGRVHYRG